MKRYEQCYFCEGTGMRGYTDGNTVVVHKNIYKCSHCNWNGLEIVENTRATPKEDV